MSLPSHSQKKASRVLQHQTTFSDISTENLELPEFYRSVHGNSGLFCLYLSVWYFQSCNFWVLFSPSIEKRKFRMCYVKLKNQESTAAFVREASETFRFRNLRVNVLTSGRETMLKSYETPHPNIFAFIVLYLQLVCGYEHTLRVDLQIPIGSR